MIKKHFGLIILYIFVTFGLSVYSYGNGYEKKYEKVKEKAEIYAIINQTHSIKAARKEYKIEYGVEAELTSDLVRAGILRESPLYNNYEWGMYSALNKGFIYLSGKVDHKICLGINDDKINKYDYLKCDELTNTPYFK